MAIWQLWATVAGLTLRDIDRDHVHVLGVLGERALQLRRVHTELWMQNDDMRSAGEWARAWVGEWLTGGQLHEPKLSSKSPEIRRGRRFRASVSVVALALTNIDL